VLDYVPGEQVGRLHMVRVAHLFIYASSFELAGREKWHAAFLSKVGHRKAFHGLGVLDVTEFNSN
jgi:hypothetical protein